MKFYEPGYTTFGRHRGVISNILTLKNIFWDLLRQHSNSRIVAFLLFNAGPAMQLSHNFLTDTFLCANGNVFRTLSEYENVCLIDQHVQQITSINHLGATVWCATCILLLWYVFGDGREGHFSRTYPPRCLAVARYQISQYFVPPYKFRVNLAVPELRRFFKSMAQLCVQFEPVFVSDSAFWFCQF